MKTEQKIKIVERFDSYYSGINNKAAFLMALNTLIISGFLIGYDDLSKVISCDNYQEFRYLTGISIFLSLGSMTLTILAILPYLSSSKKSLWFFNDVANRELEEFKRDIDESNNLSLSEDLNEQIYYLAKGLKSKHRKVFIALILNLIQFAAIAVITTTIIK